MHIDFSLIVIILIEYSYIEWLDLTRNDTIENLNLNNLKI